MKREEPPGCNPAQPPPTLKTPTSFASCASITSLNHARTSCTPSIKGFAVRTCFCTFPCAPTSNISVSGCFPLCVFVFEIAGNMQNEIYASENFLDCSCSQDAWDEAATMHFTNPECSRHRASSLLTHLYFSRGTSSSTFCYTLQSARSVTQHGGHKTASTGCGRGRKLFHFSDLCAPAMYATKCTHTTHPVCDAHCPSTLRARAKLFLFICEGWRIRMRRATFLRQPFNYATNFFVARK